MGRTLQPEDVIAHYKVIGPLGAGGMGEVYLAHDLRLDRDVALKILPPELVRSEDRVKRFVLEAKSASSLSHPHIVTIYDIGRHPVQSSGEMEASGEEVHYIAMEMVNGKTVHDHIHNDKIDLKTMLGHLAQAAEGLSKAHAAGIIHRDLKPSNIMVTTDGYAKVLDFGLAKLTEKGSTEADMTSAPTEAEKTTAGAVVGTAGYMSPEQVKGKKVDQRSDIFSFGCILYEAATRTRPFTTESKFDTMHKIVHEDPTPIDEINAEVPAELRRVIKRCLAKNADQRLQSIKDLAIELREIVDEFDTLSATATSASGIFQPMAAPRRGPAMMALVIVAAVLGAAGIVFGIWALTGGGDAEPSAGLPFQSMRMKSLMDDNDVFGATLAGDGRYLAYIKGPAGSWSLWVRQVATGSDAEILTPQSIPIRGVTFSPDGNYLYYLGRDPETPSYSALFEVPSLGGTPRKRIFDIDTAPSFSPDGKRAAFVRGVPQENQSHLIIAGLDTDEQSMLVAIKSPEEIHTIQPAWSPDGKRIVAVWHTSEQGTRHALVSFDAVTGDREFVTDPAPPDFRSLAWLPDGSGLIASTQPEGGMPAQVFFIPYPKSQARQITNDLDYYGDVSISADGNAIATLRTSWDSSLWLASVQGTGGPRQISPRSSKEGIGGVLPLEDGSLLFTASKDRYRQIWRMHQDGSGKLQLTSQAGWSFGATRLTDDQAILFTHSSEAESSRNVWRLGLQGGGLRQITDGTGEILRAVSPDGQVVLFARTEFPDEVWRTSLEGGEPQKYLDGIAYSDSYSPDGRYLFYSVDDEVEGRSRDAFMVIPAAGGEPILRFLPPGDWGQMGWSADSSALIYRHSVDGVWNLWQQPLGGGESAQLTHFSEGRISAYERSPDGRRIGIERLLDGTENIWMVNADGTEATPVTDFRDGVIFEGAWSRDSESVFVVQGEVRREVVLLEESAH